ncbi:MAG TPA: hypothetical protein VL096_10650 [Pirellulaceae bacterium]|nr:hypothetical protein [Pirellulaceae bacterium]
MSLARAVVMSWLLLLLVAPAIALAQKNIDLELVTEPGVPLNTPQKWMNALKDLDVGSLRIREGRAGDRPEIDETGSQRSPAYTVTGLITKRGKVVVPGGSFGMEDKAQFKAWLQKLSSGKANEPEEILGSFGLSKEQLVGTYELLSKKVTFDTKDKAVGEIARQIVKEIDLKITIDPEAKAALDAGEVVLDELNGLSQGTALAAALRPAGLVFLPVRVSKTQVQLRVADARSVEESWPVGWPMDKGLAETLPVMGTFLNVEISDVVLSTALNSIQQRVKAPFLYDHNGMARQRIDPAAIKVTLTPGKTYYKKILDLLLVKGKLKCEIRVDEADSPLVWISTIK